MTRPKNKLSARARNTLAIVVEHIARELYPDVYKPEPVSWRVVFDIGGSYWRGLQELWALAGYDGTPGEPKGLPEMWKRDYNPQ